MKNRFTKRLLATATTATLLLGGSLQTADACTGIRLKADDGTVVHARTMEFGIDIKSNVIVVPRGYARTATALNDKAGVKWSAKYASVGANGMDLPFIFDGLNEKGLAIGLFYFPGTAGYMKTSAADASHSVAPWELGSWMLENFASVAEVKKHIGEIVVPEVVFKAWGMVPPVHYVVHDASGDSVVIEYVNGKLNVHDNPLGVMSNSPTFDWHMTNLRNYVNLSFTNSPTMQLGPVKLAGFGQGSGMLGLPGDFTPPSRFVRAAAYTQAVAVPKDGNAAVLEAFHILNAFDIPKGAARDIERDEHGNIVADYTIWTSANDLQRKRFYFRTYENSQIRSVDLMKQPLDAKTITTFPMAGAEQIRELKP